MSEFDDPEIFRIALESLQTGLYLVDRDQRILFWNDGAERVTGYLRQEVVGRFCRDNLLAPDLAKRNVLHDAASSLASVLRDGKPTFAEICLRHKAGHRVPVRIRAVPIRNKQGAIIGAAESFEESHSAFDFERSHTKLAGHNCLDVATGVFNRRFTLMFLRENLEAFAEHLTPFSILSAQVDGMDNLKSKYGLGVISGALNVIARTIENGLYPADFLGCLSDGKFLAILTERNSAQARKAAERLRKMVGSSKIQWWGDEVPLTASWGGTGVKPGDTLESILDRAEKSLGESIAAGGDCVTVHTE